MNFSATWSDDPVDPLSPGLGPRDCMWGHGGRALVGRGEVLRIEPGTGSARFTDAIGELNDFFSHCELDAGSPPPMAFGSFTFDPEIPGSVLIVPADTTGTIADRHLRVAFENQGSLAHPRTRFEVRYAGSSVSEVDWLDSVARAVKTIEGTDLRKVVLARDIHIWSKTPFDVTTILGRLQGRFPECYTFAVDGFIGATPELLIRKQGSAVSSLVLAGSARRGADDREDAAIGSTLLASEKDRDEHDLAVRSVRSTLDPLCEDLAIGEPRLLKLANLQHIATDVTGRLGGEVNVLEIVAALHPTAAVCGTPTAAAMDTIRSLEGLNRGRYAGPVGWVDATGDGEWGIALRCAEIDGTRGRLFAGGGIVAASEPEDELEETRLKFRAMMSALEGQ